MTEEDAFRFLKAEPEEASLPPPVIKEDPDADTHVQVKREPEPSGGFHGKSAELYEQNCER